MISFTSTVFADNNSIDYSVINQINQFTPDDYANSSTYLSESCAANGTCFKGIGVRFRVLKYENGELTQVGSPVNIINDALLVDLTTTNGVAMPSSYEAFATGNYSVEQVTAPPPETRSDRWRTGRVPDMHEKENKNLIKNDADRDGTKVYSYMFDRGEQIDAHTWYKESENSSHIGEKATYSVWTWIYMSKLKRTSYPKDKIKGIPAGAINDPNLTEANVSQNNYIENVLAAKYVRISVAEINNVYGTSIAPQDIGKYYIEIQGIYRKLLPPVFVGTFVAKSLENMSARREPGEITEVRATTLSSPTQAQCEAAGHSWESEEVVVRQATSAYCTKKSAYSNVPITCSVSGSGCNNSVVCQYHSAQPEQTQTNEWCSGTVVRYTHDTAIAGWKNIHHILGSAYVGESELVYTMSDSNQSCNSNPSSDSFSNLLTDGNNKHCKLRDNETSYVQHEKKTSCTTGYDYYIGPNPTDALVGTSNSNKFGLFGSSASNCRSGVKHYFLMDYPPGNLCVTLCSTVGGNRTDEYLKCAENYCENDVDYSLGGAPHLRKRECILHSCGYNYGVDPETKGVSEKNQSVSSCANVSAFKTGTSYKADTIEKTSTCGEKIENTNSNQTICYGDKVTDYDGVQNDTAFDQRTYMTVSCQEINRINSITDVSYTSHRLGEPVDYALKVRGDLDCIASFDYEQWKVDYASIPDQDIIRRNKLKYIYDRFNNLLENGYTTNNSYTFFESNSFDGKTRNWWRMDVDGYGEINWNSLSYNANNITASLTVNEVQKNSKVRKTTENPLTVIETNKTTTKSYYDLYSGANAVYGISKPYSFDKYNVVEMTTSKNTTMQGYHLKSTVEKTYQLGKYCVDNDAKVITKADKGKCSNGTNGENKYYISFNAKESKDFTDTDRTKGDNFITEVNINTSLPTTNICVNKTCLKASHTPETLSYKDTDTCKYDVGMVEPNIGDDTLYSCTIDCDSSNPLGLGNYLGDLKVTMTTYYKGVPFEASNNYIDVYSTYTNSTKRTNGKTKNLTFTSSNKRGIERFTISGSFVGSDSNTYHCANTCTLLKTPTPLNCEVRKTGTNGEYQIVPSGSYTNISAAVLRNTMDYTDVIPVRKDPYGRYIAEVDTSNSTGSIRVYGYISDGTTSGFCWLDDEINYRAYNCPNNFKPGEYEKIKEYCDNNFKEDVNNYKDPEECMRRCIPCPSGYEPTEDTPERINKNIDVIKNNYCKTSWKDNKYKSEESCINVTYRLCVKRWTNPTTTTGEDGYIYRPVNVNNPFPSAVESSVGYATGARSIGVNWQGKTQYIESTYKTKDTPDYYVVLDTTALYSIRNKVEALERVGENNIYGKEVYMKDVDHTKEYLSSFVREEFRDIFKYIDGSPVTKDDNA
jgi:hypothetical protein